jgi:hypothetical protein
MAAKEKEYQRLQFWWGTRRAGLFAATRSRVWLGKDHLLSTDIQWYTEEYKRFYFRDIQAILICKTNKGKIINFVLAPFTVLPIVAAVVTGGGFSVFWWFVAAFFGSMMLINTVFGATCLCHVRTAVQTEELPSLRRMRRANKVLDRLRPLIAEAQGEMPAAEIAPRMEQLASHGAAAQFSAATPAAAIAPEASPAPQPPTGPSPTG